MADSYRQQSIEQWRNLAINRLVVEQQQTQSTAIDLDMSELRSLAAIDSDCLLCHVLDCQRSYLFTWGDRQLSDQQLDDLDALLIRRVEGEPIAYITGEREFWSLTLSTDSSTLIPRPDTETLVERVLDLEFVSPVVHCLDLGTGTGAIALALASERPQWRISAVDQSSQAIALAQHNAQRHQLDITIYRSSWFEQVMGRYDLIVSNPPYIDRDDPHLQQGDVRFEPLSALVADDQGYADIDLIIHQAADYLNLRGWLVFEHGYQQAEGVAQRLRDAGFQQVTSIKDLGKQPRITLGQWLGPTNLVTSTDSKLVDTSTAARQEFASDQ